jgi:hypothetical protein
MLTAGRTRIFLVAGMPASLLKRLSTEILFKSLADKKVVPLMKCMISNSFEGRQAVGGNYADFV